MKTHSSSMTRVLGVIVRRISLVSDSSTMKVDFPRPISSDATICVNDRLGAEYTAYLPYVWSGLAGMEATALNSRLNCVMDPQNH